MPFMQSSSDGGFIQFPNTLSDQHQGGPGSSGGANGSGTFGQGSAHGAGSRQRGSGSSCARFEDVLVDPDSGDAPIIGRMKTQWNEDLTLMQLLLFLFEIHTFGAASEVPEEVWEGLARAVFEVENVILNPFLTKLSSADGFEALKSLVHCWREFGPGDDVYEASRELLDKVVEPDIVGTVHPTYWRALWEYLGTSSRLPFVMWMYIVMALLWIITLAGLLTVGIMSYASPEHMSSATILAVNVIAAVFIGVFGTFSVVVGLSIAHHNAVMHGIVNFMEARRYRDMMPSDFMDGESNLSMSDSHHDGNNGNLSRSTPSIQGAGLSQVMGLGPGAAMGQNATPASSGNQIQHIANSSFGKHHGHLASSGSRAHLPRFGLQHSGGTSMMHMQSMLGGGLSTMNSTLGANNHSAIHQQEEREAKAFVLCNDTTVLTSLCVALWKHRVPVVTFSDPREFAPVALRARNDRMRILFIFSEMITETIYTSLRPMEEQYPQQIFYFSSQLHSMSRSEIVPKHLITYGVSEDDITRVILSAQEAAANVATVTHDIMRTGKHFTIPHYNLGRRLGGGAFGNVFEAEIESLGGRCAVKRIYFKAGESAERLREIGREVDIMSRLQHANIVQYLFCRREGNCICIFMELCEGGSLAGEIHKRTLTPDAIKHTLRQIIDAVMYLHENHIIHRDLKPENVLFRNGQVKLSDFGTAAKFQQIDRQQVKGTFPFMAPEVLLQEPYSYPCDVWSIGCIAADMLGITLEHRSLGMVQLTDFFKGLSMIMAIEVDADEPILKDFIERCFCRDPTRRPSPQTLLQHSLLKSEDSSIRKHMEHSRNRPMRRPSLGVVSLRSMGLGGPNYDNESEF